ncbi:MAG: hypothetical protein M5U26_01020 [Planctomycetota bacterium]|nr:hypothetical protein [Planctomycetota bacterium]
MSDLTEDQLIEQIRQTYQQGHRSIEALGRVRLWLTVALTAIVVLFLFSLFAKASSMYKARNFEEPLREESERLQPIVQNAMRNYVEKVGPQIGKLAQERFQQIRPQLEKDMREEWELFAQSVSTRTDREIREMLFRIQDRQMAIFVEHFPSLKTTEAQEAFKNRLEESLRRNMDEILVHFETRYVRELQGLEGTIHKFRPNRFERLSQDDLSRYFIHLWLNLLDLHLMEDENGGSDRG